jgi:hypothetical protein
VEVGVADAGVLDVDEDFIGAGLLDGNLLVDDGWDVLEGEGEGGEGGDVRPPVFSTTDAHCSVGTNPLVAPPMMDEGWSGVGSIEML